MLGFISISTVFADNTVTTSNTNISTTTDYSYTGEIVPYKTSYGNGGYTKIDIWWWSKFGGQLNLIHKRLYIFWIDNNYFLR